MAELLVCDVPVSVLVQGTEQQCEVRLIKLELESSHLVLELIEVDEFVRVVVKDLEENRKGEASLCYIVAYLRLDLIETESQGLLVSSGGDYCKTLRLRNTFFMLSWRLVLYRGEERLQSWVQP